MFDGGEENKFVQDSSFHDYARPNCNSSSTKSGSKIMASRKFANSQLHAPPPMVLIPEHSLAMESGTSVYSPGNGLMYETDPMDSTRALLSPCTSEALPSPMSSNLWRKDGWEQLGYIDEESIDLSACANSPFWSQIDGPPIQDYLPDIVNDSGSTDWDDFAALADSPGEFRVKSEVDTTTSSSCALKTAQPELHAGLKNESSQGPTLAQLNDSDCVLDRKPLTGLTSQSWSTTPSGTITQSDSSTPLTNVMAGWNTLYSVSCALSTTTPVQGKPIMSSALPRSNTTLMGKEMAKPLTVDSANDNKLTKLASLLSVNASNDVQLGLAPITTRETQDLPGKSLHADLPTIAAPSANLQELLCAGSEVLESQVQKPTAMTAHDNNQRSLAAGGKWKSQNSSGCTSMERKWEEIRDYIDSNTRLEEMMLANGPKPSMKHCETTKRPPEQVTTDKEMLPTKKIKIEIQGD